MIATLIVLKERPTDKQNRNTFLYITYIMPTAEGDELADSLVKNFHAFLT